MKYATLALMLLLGACSQQLSASVPEAYESWYRPDEYATRTHVQLQNDFLDHDATWGFFFRDPDGRLPSYQ